MSEAKAVKIHIEFDDGTQSDAEGPDAAFIWQHWMGLETFNWIHGGRYEGPKLKNSRIAHKRDGGERA